MSDEQQIPPDLVTTNEPIGRRRKAWGPLAVGLCTALMSFVVYGPIGLFAAFFIVGFWWFKKFWPSTPAPESPGAREFLMNAEAGRLPAARIEELSERNTDEPSGLDVLKNMKF